MGKKNEIRFSQAALDVIAKLTAHYPEGGKKSVLIPVLHLAQSEFGGWLSIEVMDYIAGILDIQPVEVYEVATFYSMFNLAPAGRNVLEICSSGPCCLSGAGDILGYLENKLRIKAGETTPDGMFSIKTTECLAACGNAPVMKVGFDYYENLNAKEIDQMIDKINKEDIKSHSNP